MVSTPAPSTAYLAMASIILTAAMSSALAQTPLIYEGQLTQAERVPDPWPGLRFSFIDDTGEVVWSTTISTDGGPIDIDPDGRFLAYLEPSAEQPWAVAGLDQPRWLRVEVCPGEWPAEPDAECAWEPLGDDQPLGAAPRALHTSADQLRASLYQTEDLVVSTNPEPGQYASIHEALAALDERLLSPGRDTRIVVQPGLYVHDAPIEVWRSDSTRLHIVGEGDDPSAVRLHFNRSPGLIVHRGARLGLFDGMTLVGDRLRLPEDPDEPNHHGVHVRQAGQLTLGQSMTVREFTSDCVASRGGFVYAEGVSVAECGDDGFIAVYNGFIEALGASSIDQPGHGVEAYYGGGIAFGNGGSQRNGIGLSATNAGWIAGQRSDLTNSVEPYQTSGAGYIDARRAAPPPPERPDDPGFIRQ